MRGGTRRDGPVLCRTSSETLTRCTRTTPVTNCILELMILMEVYG